MKPYLTSFLMGALAGVIYYLLDVRSPAPPIVALLGLLGILTGEQCVPVLKRKLSGEPLTAAWFRSECIPKITGTAPPSSKNS